MSLGRAPLHEDLLRSCRDVCDGLSSTSIYRLLHEESHRLFPDDAFRDLFAKLGRSSVSPRVVAVVMILQRWEGLSDREAVDRITYDLRWKYACGLTYDFPGFAHTVLVGMRARLKNSERPNRIFDIVLDLAKEAGLVGRRRVLDSTALYDAVATQDTVTMIRSAIRGVLRCAPADLRTELQAVVTRDDDYEKPGKPACDWNDEEARALLIDELARDGYAVLKALEGRDLPQEVREAAKLLAAVLGQDLEQTAENGPFQIARRVAPDRVISTVDPEARHGHKTESRRFDGYKGHIAIDPDSEIITATEVTAGNVGDAVPAMDLLEDLLDQAGAEQTAELEDGLADEPAKATEAIEAEEPNQPDTTSHAGVTPDDSSAAAPASDEGEATEAVPDEDPAENASVEASSSQPFEVYGDASYGVAPLVSALENLGVEPFVKVQQPASRDGKFAQDAFEIDLEAREVVCPAEKIVRLRVLKDGAMSASFGKTCQNCPLREKCTDAETGRTIRVHPQHDLIHRTRKHQSTPEWQKAYTDTRPKVERKLAHMMRRKHGGRRARVRGCVRVRQDFALLAAATNLHRLAVLGAPAKRPQRPVLA